MLVYKYACVCVWGAGYTLAFCVEYDCVCTADAEPSIAL